jgi:hypothetical protein
MLAWISFTRICSAVCGVESAIVPRGGQGVLPDLGKGLENAGHQVGNEGPRVRIGGVHGVPGEAQLGLLEEIHQERSLAIARRGGNQQDLAIEVFVQEVDQARPMEETHPPAWEDDLGAHGPIDQEHAFSLPAPAAIEKPANPNNNSPPGQPPMDGASRGGPPFAHPGSFKAGDGGRPGPRAGSPIPPEGILERPTKFERLPGTRPGSPAQLPLDVQLDRVYFTSRLIS